MKWELDFWYELWDRAGSQGLDTWYDPRGAGGENPSTEVVPEEGVIDESEPGRT